MSSFPVEPPDFILMKFECLTFVTTPRIQTLSVPVLLRGRQLRVTKVIERSVFYRPEHENASIMVQNKSMFVMHLEPSKLMCGLVYDIE